MNAALRRQPAGAPTGGQFATNTAPRSSVRLDEFHARMREQAQLLLETIRDLPGVANAEVTDSGYVRAQVRLDRIAARSDDMHEVLDSGRVSETPEAPVLLRVEEADSFAGYTRFELSDGHHRAAAKIRAGECWVTANIDPVPDEEPLDGDYYDFGPAVASGSRAERTTAYASFDALPQTAQHALRNWSRDQSAEEQEAWQCEQGFRYEIETVPMAEMKARIFDTNADMADDFGDFDSYHAWYTGGERIPDHGASRWPCIEAEPSLDPQAEYLDDGWHRFHSYVNAGHESVDVLRIVR